MKDPNNFWVWAIILGLLFVMVPYLFAGSSEPFIGELPLWFIVSLASAFVLAIFTVLVIHRRWSLAQWMLGEKD